jgi:spore coat polysaccharide biosynthesis predicted glycosyltransferase SpsG
VLFVPVSGARGMGEYARSLALASAASQRWPALDIHFVVSQQAPYAEDTPFPKTLLPSSPTFHTQEMKELIRSLRPSLVVFDNAGRTAQLRAAAASGARVVYVSSRPRQRRKAFRIGWMRILDEHWIAYPEFIAGAFGPLERFKLGLLRRPAVRFLDAILPPGDDTLATRMVDRFSLKRGEFALVVPGGGTDHPGAENAPQIVATAARALAKSGVPTLLVAAPEGSGAPQASEYLRTSQRMPMAELAELVRASRIVISNGGDTLLQAIASAKPCIAVPIAGDQSHRIARCERAGLAIGAPLEAAAIVREAASLYGDESRRQALGSRLAAANVRNGMEAALESIGRLSVPR